jgi:hypothetical protein
VNFSEAMDLFVNIFQILEPNCKIMDYGLISKKQRGLSAKSAKTGPRVDFKETQGLLCKIPKNINLTNYFPTVKVMDRERHWPTVDHGHRPGGGSPEIGRNGVPVRGTSPRLRKNGEGTEVSLTGGKRGWRRVGHNRATVGNNWRRRRSVEGELRTREHAIEGEVSVVMARGCSSSYHSGRGEGTPGRGRGKRLAVMALTPLMTGQLDEGLRSEIKEGNQGVE